MQYAISDSGKLVYLSGGSFLISQPTAPAWVDRRGVVTRLPWPARSYWKPSLSPNGRHVAIQHVAQNMGDIWVHDLLLGTESRLTFDAAGDWWPIWSPDGLRVTFGSRRSGTESLYWKRADGSGQPELLVEGTGRRVWPAAWSPDGKTLAFHSGLPNADLWTLPLDDGENPGKPEVFLATGSIERGADFSPDGRWIACYSDQSGRFEVYVRPYPRGEWLVSTEGGVNPQWSRDSGPRGTPKSGH